MMKARDLMQREVITVREEDLVTELCDLLQQAHVHGAPVVDADGRLVGFVSQEDALYGMMGMPRGSPSSGDPEKAGAAGKAGPALRVGDIMTSPAVSATEQHGVEDLCRIMWRLRVHHVPIVDEGKVTGIVSALDLCREVADGKLYPGARGDS